MAEALGTSTAEPPPRFYERPLVALAGATLLLVVAALIYPNLVPFPGLVNHVITGAVAFMAVQAISVLVYRRFGRVAGEWLGVALTMGLFLFVAGPKYTLGLVALVVVTHYVLARLLPYPLSMALLFVSLLAFSYYVPVTPMFGLTWIKGLRWCAFYGSFRLIYYCFDYQALPKAKRSIRTALSYTLFSSVLFVGAAPSLVATTTHKVARAALDRLAAVQLYRGGLKLIGVSVIRWAMVRYLPDLHLYDQLPFYLKLVVAFALSVLVGYRLSGPWDIACGIGNYCGYHMADTYMNPWGAVSPVAVWRRLNTPLVEFYLRVVGMPVVRRIRHNPRLRQLALYFVVACAMAVWHILLFEFIAATAMTARPTVAYVWGAGQGILVTAVLMPFIWYVGENMEKVAKWGAAGFAAMWLVTQFAFAYIQFASEYSARTNLTSTKPLSLVEAECLVRRTFRPQADCSDIKAGGWNPRAAQATSPTGGAPKPVPTIPAPPGPAPGARPGPFDLGAGAAAPGPR